MRKMRKDNFKNINIIVSGGHVDVDAAQEDGYYEDGNGYTLLITHSTEKFTFTFTERK